MELHTKLDLFREFAADYVAAPRPLLLKPHPGRYLAIDGEGPPASPEFTRRLGCLFNVAFTLKMSCKKDGRDYKVAPLEGLWWTTHKGEDFWKAPPEAMRWRLLIRSPEWLTDAQIRATAEALVAKGKDAAVKKVRLEKLDEGRCVQMLHVGPYAMEFETIGKMLEFATRHGVLPHGLHHEIYLSDPRRVPPARLKTILRLPVK